MEQGLTIPRGQCQLLFLSSSLALLKVSPPHGFPMGNPTYTSPSERHGSEEEPPVEFRVTQQFDV